MRILQSPRWRRRLMMASIPLAFVPLVYLGVHFSTPGKTSGPTQPGAPSLVVQPKPAPFRPVDQRAVRPVLRKFINTAVARHDVSRSWDVAAPSLKAGVSRKEWNRGQIPVAPYPAANRGLGTWSFVQYSYPNTVGLEVFVFPQPGSGYSAMTADVELVKDHAGKWLVDYWMPKRFHGPASVAQKAKTAGKGKHAAAKPRPHPQPVHQFVPPKGRARGWWWVVPVGLLSLIFLVPLLIGLGVWHRDRRVARAYLRSISER